MLKGLLCGCGTLSFQFCDTVACLTNGLQLAGFLVIAIYLIERCKLAARSFEFASRGLPLLALQELRAAAAVRSYQGLGQPLVHGSELADARQDLRFGVRLILQFGGLTVESGGKVIGGGTVSIARNRAARRVYGAEPAP